MRKKQALIRKGKGILIVVVTLLGSLFFYVGDGVSVHSAEQDGQQDWQFSKPLNFEANGSSYRAVFLDEQVYAGATQDLRDLRIVDGKGQFVPYYIDSGYEESAERQVKYATELVGTVKKEKDTSVLDFKVTPLGEHVDIQGNILTISLPQDYFLKHVEVFGSYDATAWEFVQKDDLYRTESLKKDTIDLNDTYTYSYYRLKILNNVEGLDFSQLQLSYNTSAIQWQDYQKNAKPTYEMKQEAGFTDIIIQNADHLKIKEVQLLAAGNFKRNYEVLGPDEEHIETEGVAELFRLNFKDATIADTTITAALPITSSSFKVRINNQDDLPLDISDIQIKYNLDKVVFEDRGSESYHVLYGNDNVVKPQYDIVNFKSHIEQEGVALGSLGEQMVISEKTKESAPAPKGFASKPWFSGVIIVISVVLIGLIGNKLRRT
jgi:hypothetical protein